MTFDFYKYQGTGNDFIILDDREEIFDVNNCELIMSLCERRTGIGADGLILLRNHKKYDFEMIYFNSDGKISTMCGNGGRCIAAFASLLNIVEESMTFLAIDGPHEAKILDENISLKMSNVKHIESINDDFLLDTGSPHYIKLVHNINTIDVYKEGGIIRNFKRFKKEGVNVNFVNIENSIQLRTYERGVEAETLSCGTGVVATAISLYSAKYITDSSVDIYTQGGVLNVSFDYIDLVFQNIWLTGQASLVYTGEFIC